MNQKPQAARLRQIDLVCQDHMPKPTGGALIATIPTVPFFIMLCEPPFRKILSNAGEFITRFGNRQGRNPPGRILTSLPLLMPCHPALCVSSVQPKIPTGVYHPEWGNPTGGADIIGSRCPGQWE